MLKTTYRSKTPSTRTATAEFPLSKLPLRPRKQFFMLGKLSTLNHLEFKSSTKSLLIEELLKTGWGQSKDLSEDLFAGSC